MTLDLVTLGLVTLDLVAIDGGDRRGRALARGALRPGCSIAFSRIQFLNTVIRLVRKDSHV
ncbi:hypothetical protein ACIQZO_18460 [Streptomyces sp. NPDC097617]|uniref:hypothetical protein n=1 Tax=Streptomyces sp. NPDC097617 TaxID=3366091 RepID=UPI003815EBB5